ncbi:complex I NDUFA9 subunit family protein [Microvirga aerophila]|uniref:3-beta-hydroxy-Delta(5)-steroid dehydrogenase n=1 Tax=Microvirga aerophila TaxID=670291 RepID=A0A512BZJ8_9HYPH|nr:complex I NDUFA9 subunit family protein [Microvirga aerophila]GEO17382.1 3-beta-hydroxy-Delta(5)-steroid dehydrogenase [Microvirga aerophila]
MQHVTVFGGSGFIGRHLVEHLARAGASVRSAARHSLATAKPLRLARIQHGAADILDDAAVQAAIQGADTVINLVGILSQAQRQTFTAIHEDGARRVAVSARRLGVRQLVHVSALGASPTAPALADRSKAAGEEAVRTAFPDATIIRPSLVYGPGDHFFNGFAAQARRLPALPLIGGGQTRFQPVYIEDVVAGFGAILASSASCGMTYEFGGPRVYTFKELLEFVCATVSARPLLVALPFWAAEVLGGLLQVFPSAPLTRDQVRLLRTDKVVSGSEPTLADLGVEAKALETIVPGYLAVHGRRA